MRKNWDKIALEEFEKYLELPQAFKEQYVPIYSPRACKFIYITNPVKVFQVADQVRGEDKHFLNIEEISEKFLDTNF